MANSVFIATSLDGYIATKDGGVDWLNEIPNPEQNDYGFADFMARVDAFVMGRNTYEKVVSFGQWPYTKPVFVLSHTLNSISDKFEHQAEIVTGTPKEIVEQLHVRGFLNLYVDGGHVIQSFLAEDLIDEMIISRLPVLLGDGISLFGLLSKQLKFHHVKTEVFAKELVQSHYIRNREKTI